MHCFKLFLFVVTFFILSAARLPAYQYTDELIQYEVDKENGASLVIVRSQLTEEEANIIIDFLSSNGLVATKEQTKSEQLAQLSENSWEVYVTSGDAVEAIVSLDQEKLPLRKKNLLFEEYMRRQRERFQSYGDNSEIIDSVQEEVQKIPGVTDVEVLINKPLIDQKNFGRIQATLYVRHNGSLDDPNSDFSIKIKKIAIDLIPDLKMKNLVLITEKDAPTKYELPDFFRDEG